MGMFDYVTSQFPLPAAIPETRGKYPWQSKSLDCQMDQYEIKADGSLWRETCEWPDNERKVTGWERVKMTGELRFYGFRDERQMGGWLEFVALYDCGQLMALRVVEDRPIALAQPQEKD